MPLQLMSGRCASCGDVLRGGSERVLAIDASGHVFAVCARHSVRTIRSTLDTLPDTASVMITEKELSALKMQRLFT